jgi:hypothetical protein
MARPSIWAPSVAPQARAHPLAPPPAAHQVGAAHACGRQQPGCLAAAWCMACSVWEVCQAGRSAVELERPAVPVLRVPRPLCAPACCVRAAGPPAPIHSRLIEEEERPYQRAASGQLPTAFGGSPSKPQAIQRAASGRYEDPAKMDRWDSRKLGGPSSAEEGGWQQQKARGGGDSWRGGATASPATAAPRGSVDGGRAGSGWGRDTADLARQGSSAPKDGNNNNGRWVRDEGDWRARKQSGALPEPRYDWSDSRPAAAPAAPGARGPPPGFHERCAAHAQLLRQAHLQLACAQPCRLFASTFTDTPPWPGLICPPPPSPPPLPAPAATASPSGPTTTPAPAPA